MVNWNSIASNYSWVRVWTENAIRGWHRIPYTTVPLYIYSARPLTSRSSRPHQGPKRSTGSEKSARRVVQLDYINTLPRLPLTFSSIQNVRHNATEKAPFQIYYFQLNLFYQLNCFARKFLRKRNIMRGSWKLWPTKRLCFTESTLFKISCLRFEMEKR